MINYLEIGGQKRPAFFAFSTMSLFGDTIGKPLLTDLIKISQELKASEVKVMTWCMLKRGAEKAKEEFTATVSDVEDWLDETPGAMIEVMKVIGDSQIVSKKKEPEKPKRKR